MSKPSETMAAATTLSILQLVPEALPTFRADVAALFGKYLPRHQIVCHLVGKPRDVAPDLQGFASVRRPRFFASRLKSELGFLWLCMRALLASGKPRHDVIQVRDMVSIGLLALLVARWKGLPFIYWVSFLMSEARIQRVSAQLARDGGWRNRLVLLKGKLEYFLLYRIVLPRADHVFVQSEAMLEHLRGKGVDAGRMTAVPMGVDTELLDGRQGAGARPAGWENVPLIAYLGTLDPVRQIERLVDALAIVRAEMPSACLLLIGSAPYRSDQDKLLAAAAAAGLQDAVRVTGWLPLAEAWTLLLGADAAVSYIPRDALLDVSSPTKLLEYLALGMPAVGNDSPDQVHVLSASDAGWLVRSDTAALAGGMLTILRDLPAARARAAAGPAYIERARSYRVIASSLAAQYRRLAQQ